MGNCVGGANAEANIFKVTNINDSKNLVQKGTMEVTSTELVYIDGKSKEEWHWPLKYLRKYGCDGDVFTFEAGRKCPGGEGLYAFSTRKASILFEIVARNINQGSLQPGGELSPFAEPQVTDSSILNFPARRTSTTSPTHNPQDQPSYTNLDLMGNHLENGTSPDSVPAVPAPKKFVYREVVFDRPPEEHPKPVTEPTKPTTSYTQIDFDQTAKLSEQSRVLPAGGGASGGGVPHTRTSSTSTSGNISPTKHTRRTRVHTYTSGTKQVSRSESSFSSQSSLTESSRDIRSPHKPNGSLPQDPNSTYQNVHVGTIPEQQQQYQNIHVGAGDVSQVFDTSTSSIPQQQPNYCNVNLTASGGGGGGGGVSPGAMENGRSHHHIRVNGDAMTTYAQLDLSSNKPHKKKRSMSSSAATRDCTSQSSYLQLDFHKGGGGSAGGGASGKEGAAADVAPEPSESVVTHQTSKRSASVSVTVMSASDTTSTGAVDMPTGAVATTPTTGQAVPEENGSTPAAAAAQAGASKGPVDDTKVIYHALNFAKMDALKQLTVQREQEIEQEREQRERERANTHNKKKKK